MLSFLFRLVQSFQREHAKHPDHLYLNPWHFQVLLQALPELKGQDEISRFLNMQIRVSSEAVHPYVACLPKSGDNEYR